MGEVGVLTSERLVDKVVKVERHDERVIRVKLELETLAMHIISAYAPQSGCSDLEKEEFWESLRQAVANILVDEVL